MKKIIIIYTVDGFMTAGAFDKISTAENWIIITDPKGNEHYYRVEDIVKMEFIP